MFRQAQRLVAAAGVERFEALDARRLIWRRARRRAIIEVLLKKSLAALKQTGLNRLVVAGRVGANRRLRTQLDAACAQRKVRCTTLSCTCAPTTAR